ncbi:helix-turn-helix domain-containing protein [Deinococcus sp. VB343]|uniref:helix-turn-helix domain-containing protein n=1 Tax=Deinococcus sp. VB343 TaxID=3385567 RepID=UPI0039C8E9EB
MTAIPVFNLGKYLQEHGLTAYALVKEVEGQVPASTVYGLARKPAQRIDLPTVYTLLDALGRLRGEKVSVLQVIDETEQKTVPAALPTLEQLLAQVPKQDPASFKKFSYDRNRKPISIGEGGPSIVDIISEGREPR